MTCSMFDSAIGARKLDGKIPTTTSIGLEASGASYDKLLVESTG